MDTFYIALSVQTISLIVTIAFTIGKLSSKVKSLCSRLDKIENYILFGKENHGKDTNIIVD